MLGRTTLVTTAVSACLIAGAGTALAGDGWGNVECGQTDYAGCQLGAGSGGEPSAPSKPNQPGSGSGSEDDGGEASQDSPPKPPQGDVIAGDRPPLADCHYVPSDYQPPSQGTTPISFEDSGGGAVTVRPAVHRSRIAPASPRPAQQQPRPSGQWYVFQCSGEGWADGLFRPPVWIPGGQQPGPSPEQLAQQAYSQLRLPSPQIQASPADTQLVQLPTWLWLDRGQWQPQTATASVPGVSVTATASPSSVRWSMGDGSTVSCPGPGTPFPPDTDPRATSPDCGHTYRQSSQAHQSHAYPIEATVTWTVTWSGPTGGGTLPDLTTTSIASFEVAESQALNNAPN
ncbi:hypothetical protein GCM10027597_18500 [Saccharopolyspora tripterygii]